MKHKAENYFRPCGCRSAGECTHNAFNWKRALDACVDDFARQMKRKLSQKALEGKSGWDDPEWPIADMKAQLIAHVEKGDPVDVANFAMFVWNAEGGKQVPKMKL